MIKNRENQKPVERYFLFLQQETRVNDPGLEGRGLQFQEIALFEVQGGLR